MSVQTNWGVIYCPKVGVNSKDKRWQKIKNYLTAQGVSFDFVKSDGPASVEQLAAMFTQKKYQTIVVVGGDAALYNALNGIMALTDKVTDRPALGVIPNAYVNDFARYWGIDTSDYRKAVQTLMHRRIRRIDVGTVLYGNGSTKIKRYFLNCMNVGVVASIMSLHKRTKQIFGFRTLSYLASAFLLVFQRMLFTLKMKVNTDCVSARVMNLCVGSARGYGMTPSAVPYNGQLDVSMISHPELTSLFQGLWLLFTSRFLGHKNVKSWRTRNVKVEELPNNVKVSIDGWVIGNAEGEIEVGIQPESIDFIIPD